MPKECIQLNIFNYLYTRIFIKNIKIKNILGYEYMINLIPNDAQAKNHNTKPNIARSDDGSAPSTIRRSM